MGGFEGGVALIPALLSLFDQRLQGHLFPYYSPEQCQHFCELRVPHQQGVSRVRGHQEGPAQRGLSSRRYNYVPLIWTYWKEFTVCPS